jgi:adenosylcobinamide-GDP ribazoletransferase
MFRRNSMKIWAKLLAAIAFYTCIPVPVSTLDFQKVAQLAPLVGLIIGGLLGLFDFCLGWLGMPLLTRSAIVVLTGVAITGGLHLDGAMDTADGLAVPDPERRLAVMMDSRSGAFGVMAAIAILLLKTVALADLPEWRGFLLPVVAGWGRWGQQVAIARYPYLKPTGKGAFHRLALPSFWHTTPALLLLLLLSGLPLLLFLNARWLGLGLLSGGAIGLLVPAWFNRKLGGQTGDTYGAVVEWTEVVLLLILALLYARWRASLLS